MLTLLPVLGAILLEEELCPIPRAGSEAVSFGIEADFSYGGKGAVTKFMISESFFTSYGGFQGPQGYTAVSGDLKGSHERNDSLEPSQCLLYCDEFPSLMSSCWC